MVPRWRSVHETLRRHELDPLESKDHDTSSARQLFVESVDELGSQAGAAELSDVVSGGVTLGVPSAAVQIALRLSQMEGTTVGQRLVLRHVLNQGMPFDSEIAETGVPRVDVLREQIKTARRRLGEYPRNTLAWVDLALELETLGSRENAVKAMRIALSLSPDDRHVLRSAVRLYVHQNDFERAHDVLERRAVTKADPWLLAAELATARVVGKTSRNVGFALRVIEQERYAPFHLSETAAAVGTLELESGQFKRGLKLVRKSLRSPTENAVAQASWLSSKFKFELPEHGLNDVQVFSPEAAAQAAFLRGSIDDSINEGLNWLRDESFSKRPATFVSHVLSVGKEDYAGATNVLRFSIKANPDDFTLKNNLVFCLAKQSKLDEAIRLAESLKVLGLSRHQKAVAAATLGLIDFRRGFPSLGREGYRLAIEEFRALGEQRSLTAASYYWLLEELQLDARTARPLAHSFLQKTRPHVDDPTLDILRTRLARAVDHQDTSDAGSPPVL